MKYISTRGNKQSVDSAEAIIAGLADDGGLFVPTEMPQIDKGFIERLVDVPYEERALRVLQLFLTDYTDEEIKNCIGHAYGKKKFDTEKIAPVENFSADESVLELWHGPTSAFKDMALQLLPQLMSTALVKTGEKSQIIILVATSGDTGKAALEGFKDVNQIKIVVFYPKNGVSKMQYLQMATQTGGNVSVIAVNGNFDDAQTGVKKIFGDAVFNEELHHQKVRLSSANSINWGRLVPQIVYYFSSYADLIKVGKIKNGDEINFAVPTGNFGDILAGFYAKNMGLPIHKLVCASNSNNVLTDFLKTGIYNRNRDFYKTITPSMDILISSNLERLLYHMTRDSAKVKGWMEALVSVGHYDVGAECLAEIKNTFWANWADDAKTKSRIKKVYEVQKYVPDTHTAVAWQVAEDYRQATGDNHPMVIVSTASPYKFNASVLEAMGIATEGLDEFVLLTTLAKYNTNKVPKGLASLSKIPILHKRVYEKESMREAIRTVL